ncbi:MAG: hypothetical protein ACK4NP_11575 [Parvularculaceae bacterium]
MRIAAAAAMAWGGLAVAAPTAGKQQLDDILIGADGPIVRVAVLCRTRCDITASDDPAAIGAFRIAEVERTLDIDLAGHAGPVDHLRLRPVAGASLLSLEAPARLNAARVIDCETESGPARCIEFRFDASVKAAAAPERLAEPPAARATAPTPAQATAVKETAPSPGLRSEAAPPAQEVPFLGAAVIAVEPRLREAPDAALIVPDFAPPERLAPPPSRPAPDLRSSLKERVTAPAPNAAEPFEFRREATAILGRTLDPAICEGAAARLSADAWALGAMVDVAFCKAAAGALEEADDDFTRLLAYTPDNHQALVGRGLVAIAQGRRERGLDFLQEALNALPPIAESDRIVAAMERY